MFCLLIRKASVSSVDSHCQINPLLYFISTNLQQHWNTTDTCVRASRVICKFCIEFAYAYLALIICRQWAKFTTIEPAAHGAYVNPALNACFTNTKPQTTTLYKYSIREISVVRPPRGEISFVVPLKLAGRPSR